MLLILAALVASNTIFTRDITQAYIQITQKIERKLYIQAPAETSLPPDTVLNVIHPLYGIPESFLPWYLTYLDHHITRLSMSRSTTYPCIMYINDNGILRGAVGLPVHERLAFVYAPFLFQEEREVHIVKSKPRMIFSNVPIPLNGSNIPTRGTTILMTQADQVYHLSIPTEQKAFTIQRALAQSIGVNT